MYNLSGDIPAFGYFWAEPKNKIPRPDGFMTVAHNFSNQRTPGDGESKQITALVKSSYAPQHHLSYIARGVGERVILQSVTEPIIEDRLVVKAEAVGRTFRKGYTVKQKSVSEPTEVGRKQMILGEIDGSNSTEPAALLTYTTLGRASRDEGTVLSRTHSDGRGRGGNYLHIGLVLPTTKAEKIVDDLEHDTTKIRPLARYIITELLHIEPGEELLMPQYELWPRLGVTSVNFGSEADSGPDHGRQLQIG